MSLEREEPCRSEAVARIIAATRLDGTAIDRRELAYDLELSLSLWQSAREAVSPSVTKRKNYKLDQILKSSQKLQKQLADEQAYQTISEKLNIREGNPRDAVSRLTVAVRTIIENREPLQRGRDPALFLGRSTFEFFVGVALAKIFEKYFKRSAGISRVSNGVDGPFIRFAFQALIELGFKNKGRPYSHEAIAKALTLARAGRSRRI
jgi:hypothetical protein